MCNDIYGSIEYTNKLQNFSEVNSITPIEDLFKFSIDYYKQKKGDGYVSIIDFIGLIVDNNASEKDIIAGWCLLINGMVGKTQNLYNSGVPYEVQQTIISKLYKKALNKSKFTWFQIKYYLNKFPYISTILCDI